MNKFKINETVLFHNTANPMHQPFIGKHCEIMDIKTIERVTIYVLSLAVIVDGVPNIVMATENCLRKVRPANTKTSWDDMENKTGWKPNEIL
jgi:hypothetical protein